MQIIRHREIIPSPYRESVMAIGNFDGLHLGHQALLGAAKEKAKALGKPFAVMTFEPHPRHFFRPDLPPNNLFSFREKMEHLRACGVDLVHGVAFNDTFSSLSAEDFIATLLVKQHRVSHVFTGSDFVFGHHRVGNAALLASKAHEGAFGYTAFEPLKTATGEKMSSTHIRRLLAEGKPDLAHQQLGRAFAISGKVLHGDKRGRTLGFPTLNMALKNRFVPKFGIYAVTVMEHPVIGQQTDPALSAFHGASSRRAPETIYKGVASLGIRPMYQLDMPLLETHLFDTEGDWYGKRLSVEFHHYLRSEMRFDTEAELVKQMQEDALEARERLT